MIEAKKVIKVLVVDDSAFMRKVISDILNSDDEIEVIGTARNGKEAIEKVQSLKPDIVTMDVEMPILNGIDALSKIMEMNPIPVVMLSSLTSEGAEATITALELGAVDFVQKPTSIFTMNGENLKKEVIRKIKVAAFATVQRKDPSSLTTMQRHKIEDVVFRKTTSTKGTLDHYIVGIGTSTGGPKALQYVIPLLPSNIPASFLIVQHMPPGFTKSLAERLNTLSQILVKEAEDSEIIRPGYAYIAPGDLHLEAKRNEKNELMIHLSKKPQVSGHRPSADVLFSSLANLNLPHVIGVIMTGMGSDGARGLVELKNKTKAHIIAQDEESCVVYGMPKSAVNMGIVDEITPLTKITKQIINRVGGLQ